MIYFTPICVGISESNLNFFTAIEIPDKTDRELHIVLKRAPRDPNEPQYVTKDMFIRFSNIMTNNLQQILNKMTKIESHLENIATFSHHQYTEVPKQQYQPEERHGTKRPLLQHNTVMIQQETFTPEELAMVNIGDETEEFELDVEDYPEQEVVETTNDYGTQNEVQFIEKSNKQIYAPTKKQPPAKKAKKEPIKSNPVSIQSMQHYSQQVHGGESIQILDTGSIKYQPTETIYVNDSSQQDHSEVSQVEVPSIVNNPEYEIVSVQDDLEYELPVGTLEALKQLNTDCLRDERTALAMKHKLIEISNANEQNFQKSLSCLISDVVMHQINWQGLKGRFRMKDMVLFNKIIYETWFSHIDYEQYEEQLKFLTKKAHKRYSKTQERKRHRAMGGPARIVMQIQQDSAASTGDGLQNVVVKQE